MLTALGVRDYALFADLTLELGPGLTAVTGETGAGKSLLVEALGLALGARAESAVIPPGRERTSLEAVFGLAGDETLRGWLAERDLDGGDDVCVLRRVLVRDGRGRAFINERAVTVQSLDEFGRLGVDFHGQHEHQILLAGEGPRIFLDHFAGATGAAREVAQAWARAERLAREKDELEARLARAADESAWRRHVRDELETFAPSADDFAHLDARVRRLRARERLEGALAEAASLLGDDGPAGRLARARQTLRAVSGLDPDLGPIADLLDQALIHLGEAERALARRAGEAAPDADEAARLVARHDRYHELARKHRTAPEELGRVLEDLRGTEAEEATLAAERDRLAAEALAARRAYEESAERLGRLRRVAADELLERLPPLLADLGMAHSRFTIALVPIDGGPHGRERVEFALAPHPSLPPQPLRRIASGGELSRLALAVHVAAADREGPARTLVFDEIDAGIGGRVADRVGRLLARLGRRHQVLCITHLGAIAARAGRQIGVRKRETPSGIVTEALPLEGREREAEIARMIGGDADEAARGHARSLLARARDEN